MEFEKNRESFAVQMEFMFWFERVLHFVEGFLFRSEESERSECTRSYVDGIDTEDVDRRPNDNSAEFHLKFGSCNMRRQRTLSPRGVTFSFTLVVSFHALFLTASDRAFSVRCFFVEAVKAVDTSLDVSPMTTEVLEQQFPLPRCNYNLRRGGLSGPALRYANVGDPITHVWECDPSAGWVYGVLIHSCYVDDGRGNRFELVNGRGCANDKLLLGDLHYDERRLSAYVDSRVFKYADRIQLFFTCTVQLCFRQDGGCDGISPPTCGGSSSIPRPFHSGPSRILPPTYVQRPNLHSGQSPADIFRQIARNRVFRPPTPPRPTSESEEFDGYDRLLKDDALLLNETQLMFPTIDDSSDDNSTESGRRSSRNAYNAMETDLSAELMVMPLDGQDNERDEMQKAASNAHCLQNTSTSQLCLNRTSALSLLAIILAIILVAILTVLYCMRRQRRHVIEAFERQHQPKIFLTD
ncbi:Zona pellucida domain-containing protein [Aphelenchoides bicaudatus]|nr:Zona pellucida domain-containing protein [Aphelenchoides bicaudatus]